MWCVYLLPLSPNPERQIAPHYSPESNPQDSWISTWTHHHRLLDSLDLDPDFYLACHPFCSFLSFVGALINLSWSMNSEFNEIEFYHIWCLLKTVRCFSCVPWPVCFLLILNVLDVELSRNSRGVTHRMYNLRDLQHGFEHEYYIQCLKLLKHLTESYQQRPCNVYWVSLHCSMCKMGSITPRS